MSRNNSSSTASRRQKRKKGIAHLIRGLVMEAIGVAALVFLYWTIQSTPAEQLTDSQQSAATVSSSDDNVAESVRFTGHYASSWAEYTRKTKMQTDQTSKQGSAIWIDR